MSRNLSKLRSINDGTRTLTESIAVPEVQRALDLYITNDTTNDRVLIGGCAVSYYAKPRATMDVDFLYKTKEDIPQEVDGFRRYRNGAFEDKKNNVEIEVIAPENINLDKDIVNKVFSTYEVKGGVKIASVTGLIALKLQRLGRYDAGDIAALVETGLAELDNTWPITKIQRAKFWIIVEENNLQEHCNNCER
jgi:hypothetical protein